MAAGFFIDDLTDEGVYYECGLEAVVRTSRTSDNPNRKFWSCSLYHSKSKVGCDFFAWCDLRAMQNREQRLLDFIVNLQSRVCELEEENKRLAQLVAVTPPAPALACEQCNDFATKDLQVVKQRLLAVERQLSRVVIS
ncbi:unnamed protein product [Linum trigynum]|uniref:GRF-type domain-containing protein n=1 Tax=Linum trigynum TaxID=586398 RepID=A0AAV2G7Z0_9ROSI